MAFSAVSSDLLQALQIAKGLQPLQVEAPRFSVVKQGFQIKGL